jgi:Rrf2 family nitric oxide-sensitive transcriptional repressor
MISQTAEYALRAIVYLAKEPSVAKTTKEIAEATRVPVGYLSKVLQNLSRVGLIGSQRGLYGGSRLLKAPYEITIYEVVNAVDPIPRIRTCPLQLAAHGENLCPLHRRIDGAVALIEKAFRSTTVAELIEEAAIENKVCHFPNITLEEAAM